MKMKLLLGALMFSAATANAQSAIINENFDSFTAGASVTWPQNNWSRVQNSGGPWIYVDGTTNKYVQYYSFFSSNTAGYLISPQIVAPDGNKTLTFKAMTTGGSAGAGTIEVGLVEGTGSSEIASFTPIGNIINVTATETTYSFIVPASSMQYIAFKIIGNSSHTAIQVDDITYNASIAALGVSDSEKSPNNIRFAANAENTALVFVTGKKVKNIRIYGANGQKVLEGKLNNQRFDISQLQTGVYFMIIETSDGSVTQTKFIKK